jgi:hypothetical protein
MSRLPNLERALFDAARRMDGQSADVPAGSQDRRHARRWRRRGTPLLVGLASLVVAGGAVAAAIGLLDSGDPVPSAQGPPQLTPVQGTKGFTLATVRASDPDGGPQWGIGTYDANPTAPASGVPEDIAAQFRNTVTCVVVGRVQNEQLGVVGRDGVFGNDGRFHALSPAAQSSSVCGGRAKDGTFINLSSVPPIPASGYTGAPGTSIGGCRERVNLDGPTVSPQTRRKLRGVPQCSVAGLRRVVAGFAGPRAATATLTASGYRRTLKLEPKENGAYLFVVRSASVSLARLRIRERNGKVCEPFAHTACSGLAETTRASSHSRRPIAGRFVDGKRHGRVEGSGVDSAPD